MDELTQSYGHLKLAAAHAAGGAAERMTPTYDRARGVASRRFSTTMGTFAPFYEQVREGAANARNGKGRDMKMNMKMKRNKWPVVIGLVAAGAAAGACGAMIARRRRVAAQWDEYEPMPGIEESPYGETKSSATHRVTAGAASVADTVAAKTGKLADSLHGRAHSTPSSSSSSMSSPPTSAPENTFAPFAEPEESPKPTKSTPKGPKAP
jgi:cytoskeletal protein RodZ